MKAPSCDWKRSAEQEVGIICGSDQTQEWLLPWWWSRYKDLHDFPVTFCDFGLSKEMRLWCAERGEVVCPAFEPNCVTQKQNLDTEFIVHAENSYGKRIWTARQHWFKKPFALLESSYKTAIWIDLDCEILQSISPLFSLLNPSSEIALVRDSRFSHLPQWDPEVLYNGGVIVFRHGSSLVQKWAQESTVMNHLFLGDDHLLSYLINSQQIAVQELPEIYNWKYSQWLNLNAAVIHWVSYGKEHLRHYGGMKPHFDAFLHSNSLPRGHSD